jgi:hypothetical protein
MGYANDLFTSVGGGDPGGLLNVIGIEGGLGLLTARGHARLELTAGYLAGSRSGGTGLHEVPILAGVRLYQSGDRSHLFDPYVVLAGGVDTVRLTVPGDPTSQAADLWQGEGGGGVEWRVTPGVALSLDLRYVLRQHDESSLHAWLAFTWTA